MRQHESGYLKVRLGIALVVALMLAACAPKIVPEGPPSTQPHFDAAADAIIAADGTKLPVRSWLPDGKPKAVILAIHGFNDYSRAFERPAPSLTQHGIAIYAYDQRGFGQTSNVGIWAGTPTYLNDLDVATRLIGARYPGVPFYLLGESMGGAEVMLAGSRPGAPAVSGVILVAPAVWNRANMNVFERTALWLGSHLLPDTRWSGRGFHVQASDNIAMLREYSRDPLIIKETRSDTISGLVNLMDAAQMAAPRLHVPVLALYGEHDDLVPPDPSYAVMKRLPQGATRAVYAEGYHMMLRDLDARLVLEDIASWIDDRNKPLPSGADAWARAVLAQRDNTGG